MICKHKTSLRTYLLITTVFSLLLLSCNHTQDVGEVETLNKKADSLSIKLNSPELKAVNAELLANPNDAGLYDKRAKV